ncbi:unnamed protein product [Rotaria socialis]
MCQEILHDQEFVSAENTISFDYVDHYNSNKLIMQVYNVDEVLFIVDVGYAQKNRKKGIHFIDSFLEDEISF